MRQALVLGWTLAATATAIAAYKINDAWWVVTVILVIIAMHVAFTKSGDGQ